jgi:hypothetical protein
MAHACHAIYNPPHPSLELRHRPRPINQSNFVASAAAALVQILGRVILINTSRRHPQRRILLKKVTRAQHNTQRLRRHNREILRSREMRDTKLQPADDILGLNLIIPLAPVNDSLIIRPAGLSSRLANVVASGEELVLSILGDPQRVAGETGAAPDETAGSAEQAGGFAGDDFVADGFLAGWVEFVGVDDVPGAGGFVVVVAGAFFAGFQDGFVAVESVAV